MTALLIVLGIFLLTVYFCCITKEEDWSEDAWERWKKEHHEDR